MVYRSQQPQHKHQHNNTRSNKHDLLPTSKLIPATTLAEEHTACSGPSPTDHHPLWRSCRKGRFRSCYHLLARTKERTENGGTETTRREEEHAPRVEGLCWEHSTELEARVSCYSAVCASGQRSTETTCLGKRRPMKTDSVVSHNLLDSVDSLGVKWSGQAVKTTTAGGLNQR